MSTEEFRALHTADRPLLLPNVWDAASALIVQAQGAAAVATSSAALAWSLGYPDGSALPTVELLGAVRRIRRVVSVPLTIDVEDGYSSDPEAVVRLLHQLQQAGVNGVNLEDGAAAPELLVAKIAAVRRALGSQTLFINARTDVYLLGLASGEAAVDMTLERAAHYREAGADGVFVPGVAQVGLTQRIAAGTPLPLNLMTLPAMDSVADLFAAGARRFSAGPALFSLAYGAAREAARAFVEHGDTQPMFAAKIDYGALNQALKAVGQGA